MTFFSESSSRAVKTSTMLACIAARSLIASHNEKKWKVRRRFFFSHSRLWLLDGQRGCACDIELDSLMFHDAVSVQLNELLE